MSGEVIVKSPPKNGGSLLQNCPGPIQRSIEQECGDPVTVENGTGSLFRGIRGNVQYQRDNCGQPAASPVGSLLQGITGPPC